MTAVFTELFRVAPDDLASLADPELEPNPETSIWLRGLGDLELVGLWELLPNAESDGTLMADLLSEPDAEVVLISIPDNFLQCVRDLPDSETPSVMQRWQSMDELADWSTEELAKSFRALLKLANDAIAASEIIVQKAAF